MSETRTEGELAPLKDRTARHHLRAVERAKEIVNSWSEWKRATAVFRDNKTVYIQAKEGKTMIATAELAPPVINSAQQLEPGVEEAIAERDHELHSGGGLLSPQYGGPYPPSNVAFKVLPPDQLPNPRPPRVSFAALRDPRLRMVRPIPLDVTVEQSTVVVSWSEIDEFGTGDTLSTAIDDFASALRELHHQLFASNVILGPDLQKVKQTLEQYIQPRK